MFANFSLNQTAEILDSYGIWVKCQIIEEMKVTCEVQTIGKEEN